MKGSETKFVSYMQGSDKRFVIPVYQRNYDWKTENCKQLYDDLIRLSDVDVRVTFSAALCPCIMMVSSMNIWLLTVSSV